MRTKTLLCTAAALVAGLAITKAQTVYSQNVVGYINVTIPAGFSLIANQLDSGTNQIGSLMPTPPNGSILYKMVSGNFVSDNYFFGWTDANATLNPGEGGLFYNAGAQFTNTFVGNVVLGNQTNAIPAGFSIVSSIVPQAGLLVTDLLFPVANGDIVYKTGALTSFNYFFGWAPSEPVMAVGESVLSYKTAPADWIRNFTIP